MASFPESSLSLPTGILVCHRRQLGKQRLRPELHETFNTTNSKQIVTTGHALDPSKTFFQNEMNPLVVGVMHYGRGKAERRSFLVVFFRQEAEDKFTHTKEVDHLGDAKQRRDDQSSTVGSLQEGSWTLVTHDFPEEQTKCYYIKRNTQPALAI